MHFLEDLHDVTLVKRVQDGDTAVFAQLILHYQRALYSVAITMLGNPEEANRATRTALLRTYAWIATHDPDYGFFSATFRLLVCDCLDVLMHRPSLPATGRVLVKAMGSAVLFRRLEIDEQRYRIRAAILQLAPERRAVVVLRYLAGLSYEETAIILRASAAWVRSQLHAARQQLGERLLAWSSRSTLGVDEEALLQGAIDGVLNYNDCVAHERLFNDRADAATRAAALGDLAQLLNSLGLVEAPANLAADVIERVAVLVRA